MKKNIFTICLLIFLTVSYSQKKKNIYFNEEQEEITETEFQKQKNFLYNLDLHFENDSTRTTILVKRKNYGQLNDSTFTNLKKSISPEVELDNELIIIIYYPGQDNCNTVESNTMWNIFDNDYLKKLSKIGSNNQFWIYKKYSANLKYYYQNKVKWQNDKNRTVENMFFQLHYPCFSFVVLDKKGNYISYFGEFGKDEILRISKELKNK